jgi:hypothetical protein
MEAVFANTETEKILATIQSNMDAIDDPEALEEYRQKFAAEVENFNEILGNMALLTEKATSNQITKEELAESMKVYIGEIKEKCTLLDLNESDDNDYVLTNDEIANLKAVLQGATEIIGQRKAEVTGPANDEDTDPFEASGEEMEEASEGFIKMLDSFKINTGKKSTKKKKK